MNAELSALESRIQEVVALCQRLREENRELRMKVADLETDNRRMTDKVAQARSRLEQLLARIPEDEG